MRMRQKKISEEIIVKILLSLMKNTTYQIQNVQQTPKKINTHTHTHTQINNNVLSTSWSKLLKTKDKKKTFKRAWKQCYIQMNNSTNTNFSCQWWRPEDDSAFLKSWKTKKILNSTLHMQWKYASKSRIKDIFG